ILRPPLLVAPLRTHAMDSTRRRGHGTWRDAFVFSWSTDDGFQINFPILRRVAKPAHRER
ncbi:MAG: hypothetical protein LC749_22125, partial [Actinobacteria bacterium]|nr:hypothetical protein [Actinomycetota bacterium]